MYLFTTVQTVTKIVIGNYPRRQIPMWNSSTTYKAFDTVALYDYNGTPYNNIYTSLQDGNVGNVPLSLGEYWTFKEKVAIYRPVQPVPTSHIMNKGGFTYGIGMKNATHLLIMGFFGDSIKIEELDSNYSVISSQTKTATADKNKYLFQLNSVTDNQVIRVHANSSSSSTLAGFTLVRGLIEHNLGTDTIKCQKCESLRVYTKKTSSYSDNGVKIYGTNQIVEDKKVSLTIAKEKRDDLKALLSNIIDTPIFFCKDITATEVNNGIYGYYSILDSVEDCKTGNYTFSGTVQSYPYTPPTTVNDTIDKPILTNCIPNSTPYKDMRGITVKTSDFTYDSPKIKYHHSTDWVVKDSSGNVVDELLMQTGVSKYLYVKRLQPDTYTIEVTYRDQFGNVSPTAVVSRTVVDTCYSICTDIYNDKSLKFLLPIERNTNTQQEIFNNENWNIINDSQTYKQKDLDNCYNTYFRGTSYIEIANKTQNPYRFEVGYNTEMTISFLGYFSKDSSYCHPFWLKFGSLIVSFIPPHPSTSDSYTDSWAYLESSNKRGEGSDKMLLNWEAPFGFSYVAIYANLMTRTLKFFVNAKLVKAFYDIPNTGNTTIYENKYELGRDDTGSCSNLAKYRGTIRALAVWNRELTEDELYQLQRSQKNV